MWAQLTRRVMHWRSTWGQVILKNALELAEELRSVAAGHLLVETLPGC